MKKIDECYEKAIEVINACSTKNGLYASAGHDGYNAVWSRDSMISMIGASLVKDKKFKEVFKCFFFFHHHFFKYNNMNIFI